MKGLYKFCERFKTKDTAFMFGMWTGVLLGSGICVVMGLILAWLDT